MHKGRTYAAPSGTSPYAHQHKRPFDYSALYTRCPHLRRANADGKVASYAPWVKNPLYKGEPHD